MTFTNDLEHFAVDDNYGDLVLPFVLAAIFTVNEKAYDGCVHSRPSIRTGAGDACTRHTLPPAGSTALPRGGCRPVDIIVARIRWYGRQTSTADGLASATQATVAGILPASALR